MMNEELARRLGAAPSSLGFGDPVARLALDAALTSTFFILPSNLNGGAVAGSRTRTCSLARSHSAVKSQPRLAKP